MFKPAGEFTKLIVLLQAPLSQHVFFVSCLLCELQSNLIGIYYDFCFCSFQKQPHTDRIVINSQSSQAIRFALKSLVEETERQRKIVRGLIEDNRQLR